MNRYKRLQEMSEQDRLLEEACLIEMSHKRTDAMDICMSLGEQFIKHFDKIYNENDEGTIHHHAEEMQSWVDKVFKLTLKPDGKYIRKDDLMGWFFEAGSNPEDYFTGPDIEIELDVYVDFYIDIIKQGNVLNALEEVGLYNGE